MKNPRLNWRRLTSLACLLSATLLSASQAGAFPYTVRGNETLAAIAQRFYGRIQLERVLVAANHLDRTGAKALAPGMVLEVPSTSYHRVEPGQTWETLGRELLGDERRSVFLAETNGSKPWVQPEVGQILAVPYNLAWVVSGEESLATLAYRFLGSTKQAWALTQYNDLEKRKLVRGDVLLLPLAELALTAEGQSAARLAAERLDEEARGEHFREQTASRAGVSTLAADVRSGRYVVAVGHGAELLARGELSAPLLAHVHRLLLESYVALDAPGPARSACTAFRKLEPDAILDPLLTSPKVLAACPASARPGAAP